MHACEQDACSHDLPLQAHMGQADMSESHAVSM